VASNKVLAQLQDETKFCGGVRLARWVLPGDVPAERSAQAGTPSSGGNGAPEGSQNAS
jgi:hypothetical protein